MVEVTVSRSGEREHPETYIIERLVVEREALVSVLHQLVDGQGGVVGLYHGVGHFRRRDN